MKELFDKRLTEATGNVYFLDSTALVHYAGALYGCFLFEDFKSDYLIPGEGNVFVTDAESLKQVGKMEANKENQIYSGYQNFIANNFIVIPTEKAILALRDENVIKRYHLGTVITFEDEPFAGTFGGLFHLYNVEHVEPILVTFEKEVSRVAKELGFTVFSEIRE